MYKKGKEITFDTVIRILSTWTLVGEPTLEDKGGNMNEWSQIVRSPKGAYFEVSFHANDDGRFSGDDEMHYMTRISKKDAEKWSQQDNTKVGIAGFLSREEPWELKASLDSLKKLKLPESVPV